MRGIQKRIRNGYMKINYGKKNSIFQCNLFCEWRWNHTQTVVPRFKVIISWCFKQWDYNQMLLVFFFNIWLQKYAWVLVRHWYINRSDFGCAECLDFLLQPATMSPSTEIPMPFRSSSAWFCGMHWNSNLECVCVCNKCNQICALLHCEIKKPKNQAQWRKPTDLFQRNWKWHLNCLCSVNEHVLCVARQTAPH